MKLPDDLTQVEPTESGAPYPGKPKSRGRTSAVRPGRQPLTESQRLGLNLAGVAFVFLLPVALFLYLDDFYLSLMPVVAVAPDAASEVSEQPAQVSHQLPALEAKVFLRRVDNRLPRYRPLFKQAGSRFDIPWTLLAAQGYQESRWNPRAVSPTGVRGIMQLTLVTSSSLGVRNRLDPLQSIRGGARHLARLLKYLPPEIQEPDRTWIALAAYNVGMGHVKDARELARRLGKDPNRWSDLREVLPLLARKEYYATLPHRYARGWEPVNYVRRIRGYHTLLQEHHNISSTPNSPRT